MENLTGGIPPVRYLLCVVPCKLYFAVIMITSLTACGEKEKNEDFGGTWKVDSIEYEGSKFSVEEWNNMEDEDLSGFYIIFKDGGKAYVYDDGYGDLVNWLKSDDSIMIGDLHL